MNIVTKAVEIINSCFVEFNFNKNTNKYFYSVKTPDGLTFDYSRLSDARRCALCYV